MMTRTPAVVASALCLFLTGTASARPAAPDPAGVRAAIVRLGVPFVPNAGQWDGKAAFAAQTFAGTVFVTTDGQLIYSLPGKPVASADTQRSRPPSQGGRETRERARTPGWALTETFVAPDGAALRAAPQGDRPQLTRVSYLLGSDASRHRMGLDTFERVNLGDVFPAINVQVRASGSNVEKIFTVAPHGDATQIRLRLDGATRLELAADGALLAQTGNGPVHFTPPIAFQNDARGNREPVAVYYALDTITNTYGFAAGAYDARRPLVIDPLLQSTYVGGTDIDYLAAIAVHPTSGEVVVTGQSFSSSLPSVAGGAQSTNAGGYDAFVARFNATLTGSVLQATYFGGTGYEDAQALAIHPASGEILIAGATTSTALPSLAGGAQPLTGGGIDAYIARFNSTLTGPVLQSTFFGGGQEDRAIALAIHPVSGEVLIAGYTASTALPGTTGSPQPAFGAGSYDAFVARFNATLTGSVLRASYFGGTGSERALALKVHPVSGDVLIAGQTNSLVLPGSSGGAQPLPGGAIDAFAARFDSNLAAGTLQSTFFGGSGSDYAFAMAINPSTGEILLAGRTDSAPLPASGGGAQPASGGGADAFAVRFNATLTGGVLQSTYFGGPGIDGGTAIVVHPVSGEVVLAGHTDTNSASLPGTAGGIQPGNGGGNDIFVVRISPTLAGSILQSTFLGGSGSDEIWGMAVHPVSGDLLVAGVTTSTNFPGTAGGSQPAIGGVTSEDGFITRLSPDLTLADTTPSTFAFIAQNNVPTTSLRTSNGVQITGLGGLAKAYVDGVPGGQLCVSTGALCNCNVSVFAATGLVADTQYVCVRHTSAATPDQITTTQLHIGAGVGKFRVATGNALGGCTLDVDGDGAQDALTDGLIMIRALFGLTGTAVTNNAVAIGAPRANWAQIRPYLNGNCGASFAP